ncbi:MAG: glycosyl transferase group 1 [Bacteroidetes bacterium]|nr:glycosyl transferase group 1 [Bacteroidota bacterium]
MIIGFDAKRAFCNSRGLGNYSRYIFRLMSTYYPDNQYLLFTPKSDGLYHTEADNCKTITPEGWINQSIPSFWRSYGMTKDLKHLKPDVYDGMNQELPFGFAKTGIKSVVTIHDAIFIRYPHMYDPFYRAIFKKKNSYSCNVANRIIAISEQTKQDIIEFFGVDEQKVDVVYHGCDNIFRQPISNDKITEIRNKYHLPSEFLLTVGAIEERKNQLLILEALHKGHLDIPLVIIGSPTKYLDNIKEKAREYSLENKIVVLSNVPNEDLPAFYRAASVMIYPSIFEGFGLPILEALCTETPVITSKGSCFEETGGKATVYVDPNNADELAEQINIVLHDTALRNSMIKEGLTHSLLFTDEKVAQQMMAIYSGLI